MNYREVESFIMTSCFYGQRGVAGGEGFSIRVELSEELQHSSSGADGVNTVRERCGRELQVEGRAVRVASPPLCPFSWNEKKIDVLEKQKSHFRYARFFLQEPCGAAQIRVLKEESKLDGLVILHGQSSVETLTEPPRPVQMSLLPYSENYYKTKPNKTKSAFNAKHTRSKK